MLYSALTLAVQSAAVMTVPPCMPSTLRLTVVPPDGEQAANSPPDMELSIRNLSVDCRLPAFPTIEFRDSKARPITVARRVPVGMHPGPVILPVILGGGHRATIGLGWVSASPLTSTRKVRIGEVRILMPGGSLRTLPKVLLSVAAGKTLYFMQMPARVVEGMAAD